MASCSDMNILRCRLSLDLIIPKVRAIRMQEVEGDNASLHLLVVHVVLTVHLDHGTAIARVQHRPPRLPVLDRDQLLIEVAGEGIHMLVDVIDSQLLERVKTIVKTSNTQKVDSAVFKATARSTLCVR